MNWIMGLFTKVNGPKRAFVMEEECKSGKTGVNMKAIGRMIWLMGEGDLSTQMVMYMKVSGSMTRLMEEVPIFTWTVLNIPVSGERISSTDSA